MRKPLPYGRGSVNTVAVAVIVGLAGCGHYGDFTLPERSGTGPASYAFEQMPAPVLDRGGAGEWDSRDVLNPSVTKKEGLYYNFYSGFDGRAWHTGLATSPDGVRWSKQGRVLSPENGYIAANGAALWRQGEFLYWYQAGPKEIPSLGLARSPDGRAWRKHGSPVLSPGPRGSWDERGVADPYVIRAADSFYLFYLGQDRARRQRLGVARSQDGVRWEKLRSNPLLEGGGFGAFDENGVGEPAVWAAGGFWWMLYTGRDRAENRRLGLARSPDGVRWEKLPAVFAGLQPWNAKVICDPEIEILPEGARVWFGGGDTASPDENLNGRIGAGFLRPVNATLE